MNRFGEETPARPSLRVGRSRSGFVARLEGRGSVEESRALRELVPRVLEETPGATMIVDLSACERLDSTFLGCLVSLHRLFNAPGSERFLVRAADDVAGRLFGSSGLDRILPRAPQDEMTVEWFPMPATRLGPLELGRHLLECHRRLAELGGPDAAAFAAVADQIERELAEMPAGTEDSCASRSEPNRRSEQTRPPLQRRQHNRVRYPISARPQLLVGRARFAVIDLSARGARVAAPPADLPDVGQPLEATIVFFDGARVQVSGHVLRVSVDRRECVVEFSSGVALARMRTEERRIADRPA